MKRSAGAGGKDDGDAKRGGRNHDGGDEDRRDGRREGGREGRRGGPPFEFGWSHRGDDDDLRLPSQQEWAEVSMFMFRHSPRRLQAVEQLPAGQWKDKLRKVLFARYRGLRSLERRDPESFKQRSEQLLVEDRIFGLVSDWAASNEDERPKMEQALKAHVGRLVDLDVRERKRRVERLEAELKEQRAALEKDAEQRDALVEDRYNRFLDWANRWAEKRQKDDAREKDDGRRDGKKDSD